MSASDSNAQLRKALLQWRTRKKYQPRLLPSWKQAVALTGASVLGQQLEERFNVGTIVRNALANINWGNAKHVTLYNGTENATSSQQSNNTELEISQAGKNKVEQRYGSQKQRQPTLSLGDYATATVSAVLPTGVAGAAATRHTHPHDVRKQVLGAGVGAAVGAAYAGAGAAANVAYKLVDVLRSVLGGFGQSESGHVSGESGQNMTTSVALSSEDALKHNVDNLLSNHTIQFTLEDKQNILNIVAREFALDLKKKGILMM